MTMKLPKRLLAVLPLGGRSPSRQVDGNELCFGEPVHVGEQTVVTVASASVLNIRLGGGGGGRGGGGGGWIGVLRAHATPVAYITITSASADITWLQTASPAKPERRVSLGALPVAWRAIGRRLRARQKR